MVYHFRYMRIRPANLTKAAFDRVGLGDRIFRHKASLMPQEIVRTSDSPLRWYHDESKSNSQNNDANQLQRKRSKQQVQQMRDRMKPSRPRDDPEMEPQRQGEDWDSLWKDGITPWDLGRPTPALISEIDYKIQQQQQQQQYQGVTPFQHCLVPGCGSGYDLVALAQYFDQLDSANSSSSQPQRQQHVIIGLEISPNSLERAQQIIEEESVINDIGKSCRIELYHGDFFESPKTWTPFTKPDSELSSAATKPLDPPVKYDFIFDYLFFCAIPPALRNDWGKQMSNLLEHGDDFSDDDADASANAMRHGQLLTLMFPYHHRQQKDEQSSSTLIGPPYRVNVEDYKQVLEPYGLQLQPGRSFDSEGETGKLLLGDVPYSPPETVPERQGQEMVGWWTFS